MFYASVVIVVAGRSYTNSKLIRQVMVNVTRVLLIVSY